MLPVFLVVSAKTLSWLLAAKTQTDGADQTMLPPRGGLLLLARPGGAPGARAGGEGRGREGRGGGSVKIKSNIQSKIK